jgi:predicted nucleic-acid-binding protein
MNITVDTNVLVRALTLDDPAQAKKATNLLENSPLIAVTIPTLCELVWVLTRSYGYDRPTIASAIERLLDAPNVKSDRVAVQAGLSMMKLGGDFADGVIAQQGSWIGGKTFVSFDEKAVKSLASLGHSATYLSTKTH